MFVNHRVAILGLPSKLAPKANADFESRLMWRVARLTYMTHSRAPWGWNQALSTRPSDEVFVGLPR